MDEICAAHRFRNDPARYFGRRSMMYSKEASTDLRALGPQERLMYYYSIRHPRHFCIVARIAAKRTAAEYARAISAVQQRHPLLSAGITSSEGAHPRFYTVRPSTPELLPRDAFWHWSEVVQAQLGRDFGHDDPLFRSAVLFDDAGAEVILTFHHAIADGMAAITVVEDIVWALSGAVLRPTGLPLPIDLARFARPFDAVHVAPSRIDADRSRILKVASRPLWRNFKDDEVAVKTGSLARSVAEVLRNLARTKGSSINSAICVAAALSAAKADRRQGIRVLSALDLRTLLRLDRTECSMQAAAAVVGISKEPKTPFWELARLHMEELKKLRSVDVLTQMNDMVDDILNPDCNPDLASGLLGGLNYDVVVSNLGDAGALQQIGDVRLEAIWGPVGQARLTDERFVGVITFGSEIRLIEARPVHLSSILDDLLLNLINACDP